MSFRLFGCGFLSGDERIFCRSHSAVLVITVHFAGSVQEETSDVPLLPYGFGVAANSNAVSFPLMSGTMR